MSLMVDRFLFFPWGGGREVNGRFGCDSGLPGRDGGRRLVAARQSNAVTPSKKRGDKVWQKWNERDFDRTALAGNAGWLAGVQGTV